MVFAFNLSSLIGRFTPIYHLKVGENKSTRNPIVGDNYLTRHSMAGDNYPTRHAKVGDNYPTRYSKVGDNYLFVIPAKAGIQ